MDDLDRDGKDELIFGAGTGYSRAEASGNRYAEANGNRNNFNKT